MGIVSTFIDFNIVNDYMQEVDEANALDELLYIFQKQIENFGFECFTYWVMWPPKGVWKPLYISSFRKDYPEHYIEHDFKNIDPAWKHTLSTTLPFSWSELLNDKKLLSSHKIVFDHGRDFNILSGGTLPLYGPGRTRAAISVVGSEEQDVFDKQFKNYQHILQIMGSYLHEKIINIVYYENEKGSQGQLTQREAEILLWTSRGKTQWEIGEILLISENTVRNHIQNICHKFEVTNKTHAVAIAIMNGQIIP